MNLINLDGKLTRGSSDTIDIPHLLKITATSSDPASLSEVYNPVNDELRVPSSDTIVNLQQRGGSAAWASAPARVRAPGGARSPGIRKRRGGG